MLQLILGPMFGGKTTELIRRLTRAQIAGKRVVLLRPDKDNRPELTHNKVSYDIEERFVSSIDDINWKEYEVIGIDEGQFFNSDFARRIDHVASSNRKVIISALNGTSEREPFETILQLIPLADDISYEPAVCTDCGSEHASYSFYILGTKTEAVKVGGKEAYTALCRNCYIKRSNEM